MLAAQLVKVDATRFPPEDAHMDPRCHLESRDQAVNDVAALLAEEAAMREERESAEDDEWREMVDAPDVDAPLGEVD
jgi:hypothetical protein